MKILLANHTPLEGSGSGTYTTMLAKSLAEKGHIVAVLAPRGATVVAHQAFRFLALDGVKEFPSFTGHPMSQLTYSQLHSEDIAHLTSIWTTNLSAAAKGFRPDIVHIQHCWIVAKAAARAGMRPIVTCHGSELEHMRAYPEASRDFYPDPQSLAGIVYISHHVAGAAKELLGEGHNHRVIHNPFDDSHFYLDPIKRRLLPAQVVGFVGRLVPYKRCDRFLSAVARIRSLQPQVTAWVIGDGPQRNHLKTLAQELGLDAAVSFLGWVEPGRLRECYQQCEVVVVPSENEPGGLVVPESLACGTRALVAQSGGLAETLCEPYVRSFSVKSIEDLVEQLQSMLSSSSWLGLAKAANQHAMTMFARAKHIESLQRTYAEWISVNSMY